MRVGGGSTVGDGGGESRAESYFRVGPTCATIEETVTFLAEERIGLRRTLWVPVVAVAAAVGLLLGLKSAPWRSAPPVAESAAASFEPTELRLLFPLEEPAGQAAVIEAVEAKLARDGLPFSLSFDYAPAEQYWNKLWLAAASGEPYDLVWTAFSNISDLASKKALAPLDDALRAHGKHLMEHTPSYAFRGATVDGKMYGIPRVMPLAEFQNFVAIRGDLRKKHGLPVIRAVEDMDRYLETIAREEPGVIPYFFDTGRFLLREYGDVALLGGEYLNAPVYIDPADPALRVRVTYESDFFRSIMRKGHEWQRKGYIPVLPDPSSVPDAEATFLEGGAAVTWSFLLKQTERIDAFKAANPQGELENVFLHPEKPKYLFTAADNMLSVLSTSAHVNEAVAFVDWVRSSQENYDLFSYGVEGVNYTLDGNAVSYEGIPPERRYMPISWAWNDIRLARFSRHISSAYEAELRAWDEDAVPSPTLGFVPDLAPIKSEMAQLSVVIGEYLPVLYDADGDWDAEMAAFREKLKDAGIAHVVEEIQAQFDAFRAEGGAWTNR